MSQSVDMQLLIDIAQMYYEKNMTQQQIAKKKNMSRSLVSKLLTKARSAGVVEIVIHSETLHPYRETEERLKQIFNLKYVKVCNESEGKKYSELCRETERYLMMRFPSCKRVVVSASKTLRVIADYWNVSNSFPGISFVPASGGLGELQWENNANINCFIFAQKTGAKYQQFYAPIVVDTIETKSLLCDQPFIKNVLNNGRNADLAIVGIGGSYQRFEIEETYQKDLRMDYQVDEDLVVGDVSFNYFDRKGEQIDCKWNELLMGLSLEEIKKIPEVIGIANEAEKAEGVYFAAKNHLVDSLIISASVAKRVLLYYNKNMYRKNDEKERKDR